MFETQNTSIFQYLTFEQDGDVFGINICRIKELLEIRDITKLPRSPKFVRGVINLRGQVVPVIDLKLKFGMEETVFTVDTCIIILEVEVYNEVSLFGVLVDFVKEVIDILDEDISPPPKVSVGVDSAFIYGVGKVSDEFVVILDPLKLCSHEEIEVVQEISESASTGQEDA